KPKGCDRRTRRLGGSQTPGISGGSLLKGAPKQVELRDMARQTARHGKVERKTKETEIAVSVDLDGSGRSEISTGIGFLDHMLEQLCRHSLIALEVKVKRA